MHACLAQQSKPASSVAEAPMAATLFSYHGLKDVLVRAQKTHN